MVSVAGDMQGSSRIVDLHNGLYEVFYTAPSVGAFLVHVEYADAGVNPVPVGIRGSPFTVECTDPWTKYRVLGALPARRQVSLTGSKCNDTISRHYQTALAIKRSLLLNAVLRQRASGHHCMMGVTGS